MNLIFQCRKNNPLIWVLLNILVCNTSSTAQNQTPIKQSISYTQTITKSYEISEADRHQLYEFEKVGMTFTTEVRNVILAVDNNNDLTTTKTIISSNANETWMKPATKIIIDKHGSKMYNAQNLLINQDQYTPEQSQDYLSMKNKVAAEGLKQLPAFTPITPEQIAALQGQGFEVQALEGGVIRIRKGNNEVKYNNSAKSYEIAVYEGTKMVTQTIFNYQQNGARTFPLSKIERNYETTDKGACVASVTHTQYSNYQSIGLP